MKPRLSSKCIVLSLAACACIVSLSLFVALSRANHPIPILLEGYETFTNTTYAILSMPTLRETYSLGTNAGLPLQIVENYWRISDCLRVKRALPADSFWTTTNERSYLHLPLERESGEFQLEYITTRRIWLLQKHIGPNFSRRQYLSPLLPNLSDWKSSDHKLGR
jgi:hypothetical protein